VLVEFPLIDRQFWPPRCFAQDPSRHFADSLVLRVHTLLVPSLGERGTAVYPRTNIQVIDHAPQRPISFRTADAILSVVGLDSLRLYCFGYDVVLS